MIINQISCIYHVVLYVCIYIIQFQSAYLHRSAFFSWMIPNHGMGNGCFTKQPFNHFEVDVLDSRFQFPTKISMTKENRCKTTTIMEARAVEISGLTLCPQDSRPKLSVKVYRNVTIEV